MDHLYWARLMLSKVLAGKAYTEFKHVNGPVIWRPYRYASITNCSGFINAILKKGWHFEPAERFFAETYYRAIRQEEYFDHIVKVDEVEEGDILAVYFLPETRLNADTGGMSLINKAPVEITPYEPIVPKTRQWLVEIIDQTHLPHGADDTRITHEMTNVLGLGRGCLRLYTNKEGRIVGHCWSTDPDGEFINTEKHPIAIGRFRK